MIPLPKSVGAEPFFLKSGLGQRYCLFHPPAGEACRGAFLYVHPFGDEMNKARRMAALQARELAKLGFGVLQLDLYGCGDSSGEFGDARWDIWKEDLAAGSQWLIDRLATPVSLWGLRLGALLALDYAKGAQHAVDKLILWQPVQNGATFLTQFLRLLTANGMLAAKGGKKDETNITTAGLRAALLGGEMLEVAGYEIAPELAAALERMDAAELAPTSCSVHWFETVSSLDRPMAPAVSRLAAAWRQQGVDLYQHRVPCVPFWATQEISESPELLAATSAVFQRSSHELSRAGAQLLLPS